jgi:hypothetical protein
VAEAARRPFRLMSRAKDRPSPGSGDTEGWEAGWSKRLIFGNL